jgi:hypothetical protein
LPILIISFGLLQILIRRSMITKMLNQYPINFELESKIIAIAALFMILIVIVAIYRQTVYRCLRYFLVPIVKHRYHRLPIYIISGAVAFIVFLGSIFHLSIKHEYVDAWINYKEMLMELHAIAPGFMDNTFVLIIVSPGNELVKRVVAGSEFSVHLLTLYENWSVMGLVITKGERGWKFYSDGIEIPEATWFPAEVRGPFVTHATMPIGRITYERFILFEFDGSSLRRLPEFEVETVEGNRLVLRDNPDRILTHYPSTTSIWQYVMQ